MAVDVLADVIGDIIRESSFTFLAVVFGGKFFSKRVELSDGIVDDRWLHLQFERELLS